MDMAAELIEIQAAREAEPGTPYPPDTEWQQEFEAEFPYEPTQRPGDGRRGHQAGHAEDRGRWTGCSAATSATARPRWRCAPRSRRSSTASRSRCSCRRPCWPSSTTARSRSGWSNYPFTIESISRFKTAGKQKETVQAAGEGRDRHPDRHAPARQQGRQVRRPRAGRDRRGAALRRDAQGATEADAQDGRRADDVGHADPAHAAHVACSACATSQLADDRAAGPAERRDGGDARSTAAASSWRSSASCSARGRSTSSTTACTTSTEIADEIQQMVPDARILIGHGQMGDGELEEVMVEVHPPRGGHPRLHDDHRERPRHPQRQHDHHQQRRPLRPERAAPAARPRRAVEAPRVLLPAAARRTGR